MLFGKVKYLDVSDLEDKSRPANLHYFSNEKSWMNTDIMVRTLSMLDAKMKSQNRNAILFIDNALCHPPDLKDKFSNINVCFLPKNTTSRLQPLDAGIIQNFKVNHRKLLLKFVISRVNDKKTARKTASEIVKEVDVLKAIRWVKEVWNQVDEETIRKCFRKCGFIPEVCEEIESNDQIDTEFEELVRRIDGDASSADYIDADDMVPFCQEPIDLSNEECRSLLRNEVLSNRTDENQEPVEKIVCVDSDSEEECVDAESAQPKITSLSEAIEMLDDFAEFAKRRLQDESLVSSLNKVCSAMQNLRIQNFRQKRISDYFGTGPGVHS